MAADDDVSIRDATPSDAAHVQAIYARSVETACASYETVAPDVDEMRRRMTALIEAGYPYLVAEVDGAFAGYAYASGYRPRAGYRWTVEDSVYVAPGFAGRGLGKRLLATLIARCEALGFRQMIAVIGDAENLASIRLHATLGFTHVATFRAIGWKAIGSIPGRWLDSVQMQRPLGDGDGRPPDGR
jgi:L-amino acid N-acyltransferase YncA